MWKRLGVAATALLMAAAPAPGQMIEPSNPYDPTGCNEYHRMRDRMDATAATVPKELETGELDQTGTVLIDPIYDMLSLQILWSTGVFPCDEQQVPIFGTSGF